MEDQQRRDIAIFRYAVIREATDPALTPRQRGALVRQLAAKPHLTCDGRWVGVPRRSEPPLPTDPKVTAASQTAG